MQHPTTVRERRRIATQPLRNRAADSEVEEDASAPGDVLTSSPSITQSPASENPTSPNAPTAAHENEAQQEYDSEMAEYYLYNLIRKFASATKALAVYDCQKCLSELEQLPHTHQKSPWVLAMVGRAHYEKLDYTAVRLRLTLTRDGAEAPV